MKGLRRMIALALVFVLAGGVLSIGAAAEEEAKDLTGDCNFKLCSSSRKYTSMTDGKYTTYWESNKIKQPWIVITSPEPMYGLYLCFRKMPSSFEIQVPKGDGWTTLTEGDTRFQHTFYELDGVNKLRVISTQETALQMGFNEVFVFGEGVIPEWVQRWEETWDKADLLFLMAHPDDELIFLGGAIPVYNTVMNKRVVVAYLSWCNTSRRSEALNGLWSMGVRHYPEFGGFADSYSAKAADAYKKLGKDKVLSWVTGLFRKHRPEVVVSHDFDGEYGHGQHKMLADAAAKAYELAADAAAYPEAGDGAACWQVKKLYIHLYGDESNQTRFDWQQPLEAFDGKTGEQVAAEAYALHKTQAAAEVKIKGKWHRLSVEETGSFYSNTTFGLYASTVGDDVTHTDFLENIE